MFFQILKREQVLCLLITGMKGIQLLYNYSTFIKNKIFNTTLRKKCYWIYSISAKNMYIIASNQYVMELVAYVSVVLAYSFESIIYSYMLLAEML